MSHCFYDVASLLLCSCEVRAMQGSTFDCNSHVLKTLELATWLGMLQDFHSIRYHHVHIRIRQSIQFKLQLRYDVTLLYTAFSEKYNISMFPTDFTACGSLKTGVVPTLEVPLMDAQLTHCEIVPVGANSLPHKLNRSIYNISFYCFRCHFLQPYFNVN